MLSHPDRLDMLLVGVGGQGTILASQIIGRAALAAGYDVKMSEVHGMAQRGGSVVTHVRLGRTVCSPLVARGDADVILAFEQLEALRWLPYLKPGGTLIASSQIVPPVTVLAGLARCPDDVPSYLYRHARTLEVDALDRARACGNPRAANVVLLGVLARELPLPLEVWLRAVRECVPERFLGVNLAAFEAGYNYRDG
ncbi:indolepyruvate oxidoreductase subunit beta [Desulfovirgula thermocuniculi]|uniref:indolepyruvate oxidoreductase subunit beta n=1 Tax=Desulfovirgula thermocuniculi TaxID=348842 RepID=UPI000428DD45|nr:indolepyruvate oxidoreductase subunit beta [Desulfovirgula thermocuniculi]